MNLKIEYEHRCTEAVSQRNDQWKLVQWRDFLSNCPFRLQMDLFSEYSNQSPMMILHMRSGSWETTIHGWMKARSCLPSSWLRRTCAGALEKYGSDERSKGRLRPGYVQWRSSSASNDGLHQTGFSSVSIREAVIFVVFIIVLLLGYGGIGVVGVSWWSSVCVWRQVGVRWSI